MLEKEAKLCYSYFSTVKRKMQFMTKLYKKSPLFFALSFIAIYIVVASVFDMLSEKIGTEHLFSLIFLAALSLILVLFITKNKLQGEFGLCRPLGKAKNFLYFIPLIAVSSFNLLFGFKKIVIFDAVLAAVYMVFVGFIEELIFRGLLFKAMEKDSVKAAVTVSAVTFGIGHIINLLNGAPFFSTLLQIISAVAFGFLYVILFLKTKSLLPCILSHIAINVTSVFTATAKNEAIDILLTLFLCIICISYSIFLKKFKKLC